MPALSKYFPGRAALSLIRSNRLMRSLTNLVLPNEAPGHLRQERGVFARSRPLLIAIFKERSMTIEELMAPSRLAH